MMGVGVLAPVLWSAFSTPTSFAQPAIEGGGGGRYFTGSLRDGFTCEVCHGGAEAPALETHGLPERYEPGATYTLELAWPEDVVGLVGEWVDSEGAGVGTIAVPPDAIVRDLERCAGGLLAIRTAEVDEPVARTIFAVPACGAHGARVQWTAPAMDVGTVDVHVAVVVGDGNGDLEHDGTRHLWWTIDGEPAATGCSVGHGGSWLAAGIPWFRRRRRRARRP